MRLIHEHKKEMVREERGAYIRGNASGEILKFDISAVRSVAGWGMIFQRSKKGMAQRKPYRLTVRKFV
jgi:hypothetical protein